MEEAQLLGMKIGLVGDSRYIAGARAEHDLCAAFSEHNRSRLAHSAARLANAFGARADDDDNFVFDSRHEVFCFPVSTIQRLRRSSPSVSRGLRGAISLKPPAIDCSLSLFIRRSSVAGLSRPEFTFQEDCNELRRLVERVGDRPPYFRRVNLYFFGAEHSGGRDGYVLPKRCLSVLYGNISRKDTSLALRRDTGRGPIAW